jgi:hypothetical protein
MASDQPRSDRAHPAEYLHVADELNRNGGGEPEMRSICRAWRRLEAGRLAPDARLHARARRGERGRKQPAHPREGRVAEVRLCMVS